MVHDGYFSMFLNGPGIWRSVLILGADVRWRDLQNLNHALRPIRTPVVVVGLHLRADRLIKINLVQDHSPKHQSQGRRWALGR